MMVLYGTIEVENSFCKNDSVKLFSYDLGPTFQFPKSFGIVYRYVHVYVVVSFEIETLLENWKREAYLLNGISFDSSVRKLFESFNQSLAPLRSRFMLLIIMPKFLSSIIVRAITSGSVIALTPLLRA